MEVYAAVAIDGNCKEKAFQLPKGFSFLVDDENQVVHEPSLLYLVERFMRRGRCKSPRTERDAAYDLADWITFLESTGESWRDANITTLIAYRDVLLEGISHRTHNRLAPETVGRRMIRAGDFQRYHRLLGNCKADGIDMSSLRSHIPDAHFREPEAEGGTSFNEALPARQRRAPDEGVAVMSPSEWTEIYRELCGPQFKRGMCTPPRDALASEIAISTGARLDEVAKLTVKQILALPVPDDLPDSAAVPLRLTITKRKVARTVDIPAGLVRDLRNYIKGERAVSVAAARKTWLGSSAEPQELFLNDSNARAHAGKPVSTNTLAAGFRRAVIKCGLLRTEDKINPDTGEIYTVQRAKYWFHCTRHSFAVWFYMAEVKAGNPEPWKQLQTLLGHKNLRTTIEKYLRFVPNSTERNTKAVFAAIRKKF